MTGRYTPKHPLPIAPRDNETIGGGFFVFKRGDRTGRIGIATRFPFEHGSLEQALAEAERLAALHPGKTFEVFKGALHRARVEPEARTLNAPSRGNCGGYDG